MTISVIFFCLVCGVFSTLMAYVVGKAWVETQHYGGVPCLLAWAGAIVSAIGFTWCYFVCLIVFSVSCGWFTEKDVVDILPLGHRLATLVVVFFVATVTLASWSAKYRQAVLTGQYTPTIRPSRKAKPGKQSQSNTSTNVPTIFPVDGGCLPEKILLLLILLTFAFCIGFLTTAGIIKLFANEPLPELSID